MSAHQPEHNELIRAVVVGEVPAGDPAVEARRAQCAQCASTLDRLARVVSALDDEAREELLILSLAEQAADEPGADRIAAFRQHPEFRGGLRSRRRFAPWLAAAGVAAALLLVAFLWSGRDGGAGAGPREAPPDVLLGDELVALEPFDGFGDDLVLRFHASGAIAADVAEWELAVEGDGYSESFRATGQEWSDPEAVRGFPDEITVTIFALNASGRRIATGAPVSGRRR